ncbi:MAG: 3'(2'),5'-bisphosphate nucleotidase CysQ family protein [Campylobacter sp.]
MEDLLNLAKLAAIKAGEEILKFYTHVKFEDEILASASTLSKNLHNENLQIAIKKDKSPVTSADLAANKAIFDVLKSSNLPICSEEQILNDKASAFWLVDPLDGTKDFLDGSGEFCVCIALISDHRPILGVIYLPVTNEIFFATNDINTQKELYKDGEFIGQSLKYDTQNKDVIITGKRGKNAKAAKLCEMMNFQIKKLSSAIKYCRIAQGLADVYLRYSPSYLWDNAAGEIIATKSGAKMINLKTKTQPFYDLKNLKNGEFMVISKRHLQNQKAIFDAIYENF